MVSSSSDSSLGNLICKNSYIVIQRQQFFKLHQLSDLTVNLGKDKIDLSSIVGQPFWSHFKIIPKRADKREYTLELCKKAESLSEIMMKNVLSGLDNRNISDDGKSQKLTTEEIIELRESGLSSTNIVGKLIENSKTFTSKTEFSQEKYLRKKEKKYAEYIIIREPTIRLLSSILYNKNPFQISGLRYDTLSQIVTAANIQSSGVYLLFETGTQALVGATILNYLDDEGILINISLGNQPAKQAILSMNFSEKKMDSCLSVKASTFINKMNCMEQKNDFNYNESSQVNENSSDILSDKNGENIISDFNNGLTKKRKNDGNEHYPKKKPKWADELEKAYNIIKSRKCDGIIITSKEFPLALIEKLIPFVNPSRPLVVYSSLREPLIELYAELKKRKDVIGLHLSETFLRTIQVLPDRTHPDVLMSSNGGHLLYGVIVDCGTNFNT